MNWFAAKCLCETCKAFTVNRREQEKTDRLRSQSISRPRSARERRNGRQER